MSIDMRGAAIEERLVACAAASAAHEGPLPRVDMKASAVESRLADCAEMSALCIELGTRRRTSDG